MTTKQYQISKVKPPALDRCWSACNGLDAFGIVDRDLNEARRKHGKTINHLIWAPRLVLYRQFESSPLTAKLWITRSLEDEADDIPLILAATARALSCLSGSHTEVYAALFDYQPGLQLELEVIRPYQEDLLILSSDYSYLANTINDATWTTK